MRSQIVLKNLKFLTASLACLGLLACKTQAPLAPANQPLDTVLPTTVPAVGPGSSTNSPAGEMGSSSGGGGFAEEGAKSILEQAAQELSSQIRSAGPTLFEELPEGWTQEKIADVVSDLQYDFTRTKRRHGKELMMDYGVKRGKPYLVALQAYSLSLAAVPLSIKSQEEVQAYVDDAKIRIAHELFHLLGYGITEETDAQARVMAYRLLNALDSSVVLCQADKAEVNSSSKEPYDRRVPNLFLIHPDSESVSMAWGDASTAHLDSVALVQSLLENHDDNSVRASAYATVAQLQKSAMTYQGREVLSKMMKIGSQELSNYFNSIGPGAFSVFDEPYEVAELTYENDALTFEDIILFSKNDFCPAYLSERNLCTGSDVALSVSFILDFQSQRSGSLRLEGVNFLEIYQGEYDANQDYPLERFEFRVEVDYSCESFGSEIFPTAGELDEIKNSTEAVLEREKDLFLNFRQSVRY